MNHASGALTALDPELIEVGDAIGQRAPRRGLLQGAVRPVGVAVRGRDQPPATRSAGLLTLPYRSTV
jgi:hypothetical protein